MYSEKHPKAQRNLDFVYAIFNQYISVVDVNADAVGRLRRSFGEFSLSAIGDIHLLPGDSQVDPGLSSKTHLYTGPTLG